jgi:hypothetical protein
MDMPAIAFARGRLNAVYGNERVPKFDGQRETKPQ